MSSSSPQRPGPLPKASSRRHHHGNDHHQHSKSWTARLYRKHDAKHHQPENRPLLADDNPEEPEPSETSEHEEEPRRCRNCCSGTVKGPISFFKKVGVWAKDALTAVGKAATSAGNTVAEAAKKMAEGTRNNPKKVMGGTIAGLATAVAGLSATLIIDQLQHKGAIDICYTPACVRASEFILRNLDPGLISEISTNALGFDSASIDPCADFDQFACGGFRNRFDLREDQGDIYTGSLVADDVESMLKHIILQDESKLSSKDLPLQKKLKQAFDACMDTSEARKFGLEPLKELVDHVKELMPTTSVVRDGTRRLKQTAVTLRKVNGLDEALAFLKKLNTDALIKFDVISDPKKPKEQVVVLSPVLAIGLPAPDFYRNAGLVKKYREVASKVLSIFYDVHLNSTSILRRHQNIHASVLDIAQGVVDLEVKLALALPMAHDLDSPDKTYNKIKIGEVEKLLPQVNVEAIVKELSPGYHPDEVIVAAPKYLERLSFVLGGTPPEVIQSYLAWKLVQNLAAEVEDPKLAPLKLFNANLKGANQAQPSQPWRQCVRETNQMLGWITSRFFVQQKISNSAVLAADVISGEVKKSLAELVDAADWMSEDDREQAVDKALAISHQVGSPEEHPNVGKPSAIETLYSKLKITGSHFANKLESAKFETGRTWSKLTKPTDFKAWQLYSTDVNTYYDYISNEIVLPAAVLQPPFYYGDSVPEAFSYGSLGTLTGHELAHALSSTGSLFDKNGKLGDWWDNSTRAAFDDKSECFAEQYSNFKVNGPSKDIPVNGNLTLTENIADAVGLQAAYHAWQQVNKDSSSKALPGLQKFTKDQLFFLAYANRWCSKTTPEKAAERLIMDKHAPKPARIMGAVANSKQFLEAFNCPFKKPTCEFF